MLPFCLSLQKSGRTADKMCQLAVERNLETDGVTGGLNSPFLLPCPLVLAVACLSGLLYCSPDYVALAIEEERFKNVV